MKCPACPGRYLPRQWCEDPARRGRAQIPEGTVLATKTEQGAGMITDAVTAGVPFGWLAGDEVYGRGSKLRAACEDAGKGYVLAVPVSFQVTTPGGRKAAVAALANLVPARCWETRSCGRGCKGPPRLPAGDDRDVGPAALGGGLPQDPRPR